MAEYGHGHHPDEATGARVNPPASYPAIDRLQPLRQPHGPPRWMSGPGSQGFSHNHVTAQIPPLRVLSMGELQAQFGRLMVLVDPRSSSRFLYDPENGFVRPLPNVEVKRMDPIIAAQETYQPQQDTSALSGPFQTRLVETMSGTPAGGQPLLSPTSMPEVSTQASIRPREGEQARLRASAAMEYQQVHASLMSQTGRGHLTAGFPAEVGQGYLPPSPVRTPATGTAGRAFTQTPMGSFSLGLPAVPPKATTPPYATNIPGTSSAGTPVSMRNQYPEQSPVMLDSLAPLYMAQVNMGSSSQNHVTTANTTPTAVWRERATLEQTMGDLSIDETGSDTLQAATGNRIGQTPIHFPREVTLNTASVPPFAAQHGSHLHRGMGAPPVIASLASVRPHAAGFPSPASSPASPRFDLHACPGQRARRQQPPSVKSFLEPSPAYQRHSRSPATGLRQLNFTHGQAVTQGPTFTPMEGLRKQQQQQQQRQSQEVTSDDNSDISTSTDMARTTTTTTTTRSTTEIERKKYEALRRNQLEATGMSVNYKGDPWLTGNRSADIPDDENTSLWITNLPPDCDYPTLLGSIRDCGKVYACVINPPLQDKHQTAACKLVFFDTLGAKRLLEQSWAGVFRVPNRDGSEFFKPRVGHNRIKSRAREASGIGSAQAGAAADAISRNVAVGGGGVNKYTINNQQQQQQQQSRCLYITGPSSLVNEAQLTSFFKSKFDYQLQSVATL